MRLIKAVAEALAIDGNAPQVTLDHVRRALNMLALRTGPEATAVLRYLNMKQPERAAPHEHVMRLLAIARTSPAVPLSAEVEAFSNKFGENVRVSLLPAFAEAPGSKIGARTRTRTSVSTPKAKAVKKSGPIPAAELAAIEEQAMDALMDVDPWGWGEDGLPSPVQALTLSRELRGFLQDRLLGQPQVVDALANGIVYEALRGERRGPLATLFLVGPPACGKTYTTELLVDALKGEWPRKTIDMSSMQSANQAFALTGMSRGYSEALPGELTKFVLDNPRSIVVLENIDKAHPNNQNVLLPVFDSGFLKDQFGFFPGNDMTRAPLAPPEVDFRNVILIITTSAASGTLQNPDFRAHLEQHPEQLKSAVIGVLAKQLSEGKEGLMPSFSPDLLSRLSSQLMLIYRPLPLAALETIARKTYDAFCSSLRPAFGCSVECEHLEVLTRAATLSFGETLDARKVSGSAVEHVIFGPVIDEIQAHEDGAVVKRVVFNLDQAFRDEFEKLVNDLDPGDPIRELRRKQWSLGFSRTTERSGDQITVHWRAPRWITSLRAGDIGTAGGLQTVIPDVGFEDIAGHNIVKMRLKETVRLLRDPQRLKELDISLPRGMLLYGSPGTGKTMLAKALAKEAALPFIATTGPELLDQKMMHAIFERARYYAPSILFIDEIDALGNRDDKGYPIAINQLLAELDGFDSAAGGVFCVAATNYPERVDRAILRAGRLDLHVEVPALDPEARLYFFKLLKDLPGGDLLDFDALVRLSSGMTGADLVRARRELALDLIRTGKTALVQSDAEEMLSVIKYGDRRAAMDNEELRKHTAYHEAGHALVSRQLIPERRIELVTIVPRARYVGLVSFDADQAHRPLTRQRVLYEMAIGLAGRLSQRRQFGDEGVDDGASSDLVMVSGLARRAIVRLGLDEVVGYRVLQPEHTHLEPLVEERVDHWIAEAMAIATSQIEALATQIDVLAQKLLLEETIAGNAIE